MKKAESRRRNNIIKALKEEFPSGFFFHIHGNPFQEAGIPDIIGCVESFFFGLEVKEPGGEATRIQLHFGSRIQRAHGQFMVVEEPEEAVRFVKQGILKLKQANSSNGPQMA